MKDKKVFYGVVILFLLVLALFAWNKYQFQVQERPIKPIQLPPQLSGKCGIESCHGLDITCGPNVPEACDTMYAVGDNCRQFASCQTIAGSCQLVANEKFSNCKTCVEQCSADFQSDVIALSTCESKCSE